MNQTFSTPMLRALVYLLSMSAGLMPAGILPSCCIANSAATPRYGQTASAPYPKRVHRWCTWCTAKLSQGLGLLTTLVKCRAQRCPDGMQIHTASALQGCMLAGSTSRASAVSTSSPVRVRFSWATR